MQQNSRVETRKKVRNSPYFLVIGLILLISIVLIGFYVHISMLDGLDGLFFRLLFERKTVFSQDYSEKEFKKIKVGMPVNEVISRVGFPLRLYQWYASNSHKKIDRFLMGICFVDGVVQSFRLKKPKVSESTEFAPNFEIEKLERIQMGMNRTEVKNVLGKHLGETLVYSETPNDSSYRIRVIIVEDGIVVEKIAYFYVD